MLQPVEVSTTAPTREEREQKITNFLLENPTLYKAHKIFQDYVLPVGIGAGANMLLHTVQLSLGKTHTESALYGALVVLALLYRQSVR